MVSMLEMVIRLDNLLEIIAGTKKEKKYVQTKYRYIQNLDISQIISEEADGSEHHNEFVNYLRKQIDEAYSSSTTAESDSQPAKKPQPKRRPKYFDAKNSLDIWFNL